MMHGRKNIKLQFTDKIEYT